MEKEWIWTEEDTKCATLRWIARGLEDYVKDLGYLGVQGLDDIAEALVKAAVALRNRADDWYPECDC